MAARHGVGAIARCVLDSGALTGLMDDAAFTAHHFLKGADYAAYKRWLCALRDAFVDSAVENLDELALRFAIRDPRISTITLWLKTVAKVHGATDIIARGRLLDSVLGQIVTHHVWTKNAYERLV